MRLPSVHRGLMLRPTAHGASGSLASASGCSPSASYALFVLLFPITTNRCRLVTFLGRTGRPVRWWKQANRLFAKTFHPQSIGLSRDFWSPVLTSPNFPIQAESSLSKPFPKMTELERSGSRIFHLVPHGKTRSRGQNTRASCSLMHGTPTSGAKSQASLAAAFGKAASDQHLGEPTKTSRSLFE